MSPILGADSGSKVSPRSMPLRIRDLGHGSAGHFPAWSLGESTSLRTSASSTAKCGEALPGGALRNYLTVKRCSDTVFTV